MENIYYIFCSFVWDPIYSATSWQDSDNSEVARLQSQLDDALSAIRQLQAAASSTPGTPTPTISWGSPSPGSVSTPTTTGPGTDVS